ncbi:MAG: NAD(P)-dependent glycerol-3-phosphate dehydrogenase [Negativicutes bacterium]|nr:NAD(P)-dependent glycerol-3-phosphate dehydrogenase [Negativicutes bacterium]
MDKKIAVLGAGAWGTVIAKMLAENGHRVDLWSYDREVAQQINEEHQNQSFLPGVSLPDTIIAGVDLCAVLAEAKAVVNVVIAKGLRALLQQMPPDVQRLPWLSATKGLEPDTALRMSQIIIGMGKAKENQLAVLSGPNLAVEIAAASPASSVIGAVSKETALYFQELLMRPYFRIYISPDPIGVELGGALKNIIALAAGICDGLKLGDNAKAALIARGLAEISRLGCRLGADQETFAGLSGMGDLVATCASPHSRNRWCGEQLGLGRSLDDIMAGTKSVVEGVRTTTAVYQLAEQLDLDLPITRAVYGILYEGASARLQVEQLMNRMAKPENSDLALKKW